MGDRISRGRQPLGDRLRSPGRAAAERALSAAPVSLTVLAPTFAVARLGPDAPLPEWASGGELCSATRSAGELSIVCEASRVPAAVRAERDWRCLAVEGPLDFSEVGIMASLSGALADGGISLFALSTFDTDYLLVRADHLDAAVGALRRAGHRVPGRAPSA